jgi:hypothetical protein
MKLATVFLAIAVLLFMQTDARGQDSKEESRPVENSMRTQLRVSIKDSNRGLSFELHPDGKVELKVQEENQKTGSTEDKSYKADSLEEFKTKYPDAAKKYQIDRFVPRLPWGKFDRSSEKAWEEWKQWFEEDWFWDRGRDFARWFREWWTPFQSDDLDNWVEEQGKLFERFRDLRRPRDPSKEDRETPTSSPSFGLRVGAVGDTLAAQLGLREGEGALVVDVVEGTPAQKAGLKKHDVILKFDGRVITDRGEFRKHLREQAEKGLELEFIRQGKRETIKIKAADK